MEFCEVSFLFLPYGSEVLTEVVRFVLQVSLLTEPSHQLAHDLFLMGEFGENIHV